MAQPSTIQQWVTKQDGLRNLSQVTVSSPKLGEGEVLVKIHTVSLNYRDTEVCNGTYGHHKSISQGGALVPCSDMCGTITETKSSKWKPGDRVLSIFNQTHLTGQVTEKDMASGLGLPLPGVLAQYRVFPEYGLVKVPDYLTDEEACTLPIAAVTAWMSINWMRQVGQPMTGPNTTVLVQGTGGVSVAGLQIAKACGMKCIVTSSSDKKLRQASSLGADHVINYRSDPDWHTTVLQLTGGHGADIIIETGGAMTLPKSFDCISFGGCIAAVGYLSGKEDLQGERMNANVLALKRNVTLKGILNGPRDRFEEMLRVYEKERIKPVVDRTFSFAEAKEALGYLERGGHFGKVVIRVSE